MICKLHPKYQGKRKPRVPCDDCWFLYLWKKYGCEEEVDGKKANTQRRLDTPVHDG